MEKKRRFNIRQKPKSILGAFPSILGQNIRVILHIPDIFTYGENKGLKWHFMLIFRKRMRVPL